jgi:hypothetical protein
VSDTQPRFTDPDNDPPAEVTQLTDSTGDLLIRLADDTWVWARIGTQTFHHFPGEGNGYDWQDVVGELAEGDAFVEAPTTQVAL